MDTIELTNEQSRCVVKLFAENLGPQLKKPMLLTSKKDLSDKMIELAKKYNCHFVTNVTTTLVQQTVYEILLLDMAREMVEQFDCHLVFNLQ